MRHCSSTLQLTFFCVFCWSPSYLSHMYSVLVFGCVQLCHAHYAIWWCTVLFSTSCSYYYTWNLVLICQYSSFFCKIFLSNPFHCCTDIHYCTDCSARGITIHGLNFNIGSKKNTFNWWIWYLPRCWTISLPISS